MVRRFWSSTEVKLVRRQYATTPNHVLAKTLGRSEQSVQSMAMKKMGLHKQMSWNEKKVGTLRRLYPDKFLHELEPIFGMTGSAISYKAKQLGLKKSELYNARRLERQRPSRLARGCHEWTRKENDFLRAHYPTVEAQEIARKLRLTLPQIYQQAWRLGLKKDPNFNRELGRKWSQHPKAVAQRFKKGQAAWNKGRHTWAGRQQSSAMRATQFKKGRSPKNTKYDGAIVVRQCHRDRDEKPYKWIRLSKGKWEMLHVHVWKQANGPVPEGRLIVFADGDTMNCDLSNLHCITHEQHARNSQQSDGYIAARLSIQKGAKGRIDREMFHRLLKCPALLDAKRKQLQLNKLLKANDGKG